MFFLSSKQLQQLEYKNQRYHRYNYRPGEQFTKELLQRLRFVNIHYRLPASHGTLAGVARLTAAPARFREDIVIEVWEGSRH